METKRKGWRPNSIIHFEKSEIAERDGWECFFCFKVIDKQTATIEHLEPLSLGGSHEWNNLRLACSPCNNFLGNKSVEDKLKYRDWFTERRNLMGEDQ